MSRFSFWYVSAFALLSLCPLLTARSASDPLKRMIRQTPGQVRVSGDQAHADGLTLKREWDGPLLRTTLTNRSDGPVEVGEVVLFDIAHGQPGETAFYGEGFTKLSQTAGTLADPVDLDEYTDRGHYRLPEPEGFRTVYGLCTLSPDDGAEMVMGFTSCRRFVGKFHVNEERIIAVVDTEGLTLAPGQSWELEELMVAQGEDRNALLAQLAERIAEHHPRLPHPSLPTGWCSWYCFGPRVTAQDVMDNLAAIEEHVPELRYIQIDDGYQPWMGDWLETGKAFGGGVQQVLHKIREEGFEPAIWIAPFVASPQSNLFRDHPEWFIKDDAGQPLRSDRVTFGGWRLGPWYMLDGTHPGAQQYLERVGRIMRDQWGVTYFKLDANAWGAFPFGQLHDSSASHVEAYRRGMAALRRGTRDAFLLGCNHPLWPSLGEIHGSRSSMDIIRSWDGMTRIAREALMRNWQNDRLWWNDPDCLVLTGDLPPHVFDFHKAVIYASGGMLLSGDDLTQYNEAQFDILRRAAANPGQAAAFESTDLEVGRIKRDDHELVVLLNWSDTPARREVTLERLSHVVDFWTGEDLGRHVGRFVLDKMPARSGRLLILRAE